jgi:hypothetical protein
MQREQLMQLLRDKYPSLFLRTSEEFNKEYRGGIWTSGEDSPLAKDGCPIFYYDATSPRYELGVHQEIYKLLDKHGWYAEWYDAGTLLICEG